MHRSTHLSILYGAFHGSRMLIGAIHSLYLLSTGIKLPQLAILQIVYSLTVLLMEFPTGVIADTYSRKASVLVSCGLVSCFYILCLFSPDMRFLIASEIFYGIGLCFISGALEAWITETVNEEYPNDPLKINHFGHLRMEYAAIGTMMTGPLGAFLVLIVPYGFASVYLLSCVVMVSLLVLFSRVPYTSRHSSSPNAREYYQTLTLSLKACWNSRNGLFYLGLLGILVAIYQPVFHYWQPLFMSLTQSDATLPPFLKQDVAILGITFFAYSLMKYLLNLYSRKKLLNRFNPFSIGLVASMASAILIAALSLLSQKPIYFYIVLFALFQSTTSIVDIITESQYLKVAPQKHIASILSAATMFTRILGIGILLLMAIFVNNENLPRFFLLCSILFCFYAVGLSLWKRGYAIKRI